jgi:hypothetical protein
MLSPMASAMPNSLSAHQPIAWQASHSRMTSGPEGQQQHPQQPKRCADKTVIPKRFFHNFIPGSSSWLVCFSIE